MPLPPESPSQRELIERAKHDRAAFGVLFELHFDSIFGYAYRRTGDWDAACDITSEVFVNALEHLAGEREVGREIVRVIRGERQTRVNRPGHRTHGVGTSHRGA